MGIENTRTADRYNGENPMDPPEVERLLTPQEVAVRYGVPLATIYRWNSTGAGPRYVRAGRHVRYRLADCVAWEEVNASEPRSA